MVVTMVEVNDPMCYNKVVGGGKGTFGLVMSKETLFNWSNKGSSRNVIPLLALTNF